VKKRTSIVTKSLIALGLLLGTLSLPQTARAAVPGFLTQQGRLFDAKNQPVDGLIDVRFSLYEDAASRVASWTEVAEVRFDDGYFVVHLGTVVPFDASIFDGSEKFLGVTIGDDEELSPRAAVGSVPYALVCGDVRGDIHPTSLSIGNQLVIDANGRWVGDTTGLVGPQGPQGPQGLLGMAGPVGDQGAAGPQGPEGRAGSDGPMGPEGPEGKPGALGPMGPQGTPGLDGAEGAMGPKGADGDVGPRGLAGPQGLAGSDGAVGPMGPQGFAGQDGAMGPMGPMGLPGQDGDIGPMGPQGFAGQDGAMGPVGPVGLPGKDGDIGPMGPMGLPGQDGAKGSLGPQGLAGQDGAAGPMGPAGQDGATGPMGPQGFAGQDGATGPMGPQGFAGQDGATGPMGPMGLPGQDGWMGPMGPMGLPGQDGSIGPMGPAGQDGAPGATGPAGQDGSMGPEGPQGVPGPASSTQVLPLWGTVDYLPSNQSSYAFVGAIGYVYVGPYQVLFGSAQASMGSSMADTHFSWGASMKYDLCYQALGDSTVQPFSGYYAADGDLDTRRLSWSASASVSLPSGAYLVGFCVMNSSDFPIDMTGTTSGWIQVVDSSYYYN
jgi:hypothetical protein